MEINQYAVHWINLDLAIGSEVNKIRPCVILSPNEMNAYLRTVIIAPLTHTLKPYPSRVICTIKGEKGALMLDQIRTIDKTRLRNLMGKLNAKEIVKVKYIINQMLC